MTERIQGNDETINLELDYELDLAFMHSVPRFGHSHNIAQLASPDIDRRWDYLNGVVLFCISIVVFFILWACAQIVLKSMGKERVGCASGQAIHKPNDISKCGGRIKKKHQKIQFAFILSCGAVFAGGSVLLRNGLPSLNIAVTETLALNQDVTMSLEKGLGVASAAGSVRSSLMTSSAHEVLLSDNYCVNTNSNVASLLLNGTYDEESMQVFTNFQKKIREDEVGGVQSGILHILDNLQHFDSILVFYNSYHWIARMLILVLFNLCLFLMASTIVTLFRKDNFPPLKFMTSYFILPLFALLVFIIWFAMVLFAAGSIMNSDLCVGSGEGPESTIQNALLENGFNVADLTYKSFLYYKGECASEEPWSETVTEYRDLIEEGRNVAEFVLSRISSMGVTNLMNICGRDFHPIITEIENTWRDLVALTDIMNEAVELGRCDRVLPIYERFFNGPACKESLEGLSRSFYSLFTACLGGILMFSFRSALYQIKLIQSDGGDDKNSLDNSKAGEKDNEERNIGRTFTIDSGNTDPISISMSKSNDMSNAPSTQERRPRNNYSEDDELEPLSPPSATGRMYSKQSFNLDETDHDESDHDKSDHDETSKSPSSFISSSLSGSFDSFV